MSDVLCLGSCVLDLYAQDRKPTVGGDAANQAILLTKLGLSAACCALLGQDEEADLIRSQLKAQGADIRWLSQLPDQITTHSFSWMKMGSGSLPWPGKLTAISPWLTFHSGLCRFSKFYP